MKKLIATVMLLTASTFAYAENFEAGVGYTNLSDSGISLNALYATGGYTFEVSPGFTIIPECRVGVGVGSDNYNGVDIKLDSLYGFNVRAEWQAQQAYVFVVPSYTNVKMSASLAGVSASGSEWDWGGGVGAGYKLNDKTSVEFAYEDFTGSKLFSLGLRFKLPNQ